MKWLLVFACACGSNDTPAVPAPAPVTPSPVAAVDAGQAWPTLDCDALLSASEIASVCHISTFTARKEANEGTDTEASPPNPVSRQLCNRSFEVPGRGKVGAFGLTAYPDTTWPKQLAKVWGHEYGAINLKAHKTEVFSRRDIDGVVGRYQWNLFETDQKGEAQLCTDDQWRALAKRLIDRL